MSARDRDGQDDYEPGSILKPVEGFVDAHMLDESGEGGGYGDDSGGYVGGEQSFGYSQGSGQARSGEGFYQEEVGYGDDGQYDEGY